MSESDCTAFLQWALPRAGLRWPGFRKVRRQVCKRLRRRISELGLADFAAYRTRLEIDPAEWRVLDECCHITISRFFRDKRLFEALRRLVLPEIAARARREERDARIWSAGCASGEEPYTLSILWDHEVAPVFPSVALSIVATDVDQAMLGRAREGCFEATSLHELPPYLVGRAFEQAGPAYRVKDDHRKRIAFPRQDLRTEAPEGPFDLILCRNVAFTYFDQSFQREVLARLTARLNPDGCLVIGSHERLSCETSGLAPLVGAPHLFVKRPLRDR